MWILPEKTRMYNLTKHVFFPERISIITQFFNWLQYKKINAFKKQ